MADTTYLTRAVEPHLIKWVARKIDVPLSKRRVVVGKNADDRDVSFEVDGVLDGTATLVTPPNKQPPLLSAV